MTSKLTQSNERDPPAGRPEQACDRRALDVLVHPDHVQQPGEVLEQRRGRGGPEAAPRERDGLDEHVGPACSGILVV